MRLISFYFNYLKTKNMLRGAILPSCMSDYIYYSPNHSNTKLSYFHFIKIIYDEGVIWIYNQEETCMP